MKQPEHTVLNLSPKIIEAIMRTALFFSVIFLFALAISPFAPHSQAENSCHGLCVACGQSTPLGGVFSRPYASGRIPTPPYFALHPPVYYSLPIARSYGYSPFAFPSTIGAPKISIVQPKEVLNPYVKPEEIEGQPAKLKVTVTVKPKTVANSYASDAIADSN